MSQAVLLAPPRRSGTPPGLAGLFSGDRLFATTLALSIVVHAIVLLIHFRPFDPDRRLRESPPLEIALVNARSQSRPAQADILAQANLDGGGNTDAKVRAKTPLPVMPKREPVPDPAPALPEPVRQPAPTPPEPARRLEQLEQQTRELMSKLKAGAPALAEFKAVEPAPKEPVEKQETNEAPSAGELLRKTAEAMQLEAQIARDMQAYQQRPKRRFIGARAQEYRFARYVEDWRLKIERVGNLNYPEAARQQKLYGHLLVTVSIRADGTVEAVEINRTSGHRVLDAAVVKIIELAAPFAPFPADIRRDTDILHVTRTWTFARGDSFQGQ